MRTLVRAANEPDALQIALDLLRQGEVVAIPTDTVYGVATDGFDASAVEKLFVVKDRPSHKAIMLLLGEYEDLEKAAAYVSPNAQRLAAAFWPGGLTLVIPAREGLPANLRADTNSIGVRLPDSDLVTELVKGLGRPLAATSANLSGGANPRTAQDVLRDLDGRLPLILDGGETPAALPSTVIDCTVEPPRLLRAGAIARDAIENVLGAALAS
jgi:L-threonylcarbamoyladenylate synthase